MDKKKIIFVIVLSFLSFLASSACKVYVKGFSLRVQEMERQTEKLKNEVQVLKAEMTYLSNPDRISHIAKDHLKLNKIKTEQVHHLYSKKDTSIAEDIASSSEATTASNWHYKSREKIFKLVKFSR